MILRQVLEFVATVAVAFVIASVLGIGFLLLLVKLSFFDCASNTRKREARRQEASRR